MELLIERVDVWAAELPDQAGALANVLTALKDAGANLTSIIARRGSEGSGKGVVFVSPLAGDSEIRAAADVGFNVTRKLHSVRVQGRDRPGVAADVLQAIAAQGVNLRGFSASALGRDFIAYVAVDSFEDARTVMNALERM
ncbi:MAG: ACT domain-containing protein [Rhodocyclaceae bacterium]|nr:ACT domain-containing protein [Rhodocyclaceae bacterium]MBX3666828.1 ACT domain-containing protein [Rhodocyclaceae bacterium]